MKMALVCAAKSCKSHEFENENSNLVFFPFPDDEETCRTWVLRSGRNDLLYRRVEEIHLTEFLCERHFEDTCLDRSGSVILKPNATPTLFEPYQSPLVKEEMEDKDEPSSVSPDIVVIPCVIMNGVDTEVIGFDGENIKEENINRDEIEQELRLIHEGCLVDNNVLSQDTDRIEVHRQVSTELHSTVNERSILDPDTLVVDGIETVETCASYLKEWQDSSVSSLTNQLCRVCGAESNELIPVFGEQSVHLQIIDKIQWHLPIVVKEDDKLPLKICTSCVSLLNSWHDLVTTCMETDTKLRKLFNDEEFDPSSSVYCDLNPSTPDRVMEPSVRQLHDVLSSDTLESEPDNQNILPLDEISLQTTEDSSVGLEMPKDTQVTGAVQFFNRTEEFKEKSLRRSSRLGAGGITLRKRHPRNKSVSSKDAHQIIRCSSIKEEEDYEEMSDSQSKGEDGKEAEGRESFGVDESLVSYQVPNEKSDGIKIELSEDSNEFLIDEGNVEKEEEGEGEAVERGDDEEGEEDEEDELEEEEEDEDEEEEAGCDNENNNVRGEGEEKEKGNGRYRESRNKKMTRAVLCDLCGFSCNKKSTMLQHICDRHSSSASMFMCEYCDKMFTSEAFKEAHERSHINFSLSPNQGQGKGRQRSLSGKAAPAPAPRAAALPPLSSSPASSVSSVLLASSNGNSSSHSNPCFVCEYCGRSFRTKKTLKEHHIAMHSDDKPYKCDKCDKNYGSLSSLDIHRATHSSETPYLCDLCGKTFKHVSNLRSHKRSHLDDSDKNRYVCAQCGKGFRSRFHLSEHTNVHDGRRPYTCEVCGKSFHKKIQLRQHGSAHSGTQPFNCPVCGVKFNRRGNMTQHVKRHTQERKYTCRVCAASFPTLGAVLNHRKKHSDAEVQRSAATQPPTPLRPAEDPERVAFKCPTCGKLLAKKESLAIHLRSHSGEKLFPCPQCGKRLSNKGSLAYHVRSFHTGERPHACRFCGDGFLSKEARLVHERIHTGEKPFACDLCGMAFRCSSNLAQHARVHSDARPHACAACGKRFQRKGALDVHMRTHTGERPFACDLCGRAFTQKNDMLKHRRTHTLEKPFACAHCPCAFARKRDLSRHRLDKHTNTNTNTNMTTTTTTTTTTMTTTTTTMIVTQQNSNDDDHQDVNEEEDDDDDDGDQVDHDHHHHHHHNVIVSQHQQHHQQQQHHHIQLQLHDVPQDLENNLQENLNLGLVKRKVAAAGGGEDIIIGGKTTVVPPNASSPHHHHHILHPHPHHEDSNSREEDSSMHTVVITTADNLLSTFPGIEHTQTVILQRF